MSAPLKVKIEKSGAYVLSFGFELTGPLRKLSDYRRIFRRIRHPLFNPADGATWLDLKDALQSSSQELKKMPSEFRDRNRLYHLEEAFPAWIGRELDVQKSIREWYLTSTVPSENNGHDEFLVRLFVRKNSMLTVKGRKGFMTIKILRMPRTPLYG